MRLAIIAITTIAGVGGAGAQATRQTPVPEVEFLHATSPTLEKITSYPSSLVVPLNRPDANELSLSSLPVPKRVVMKTVLRDEWGGRLDIHHARFTAYSKSGTDIEIRGVCFSACTLILGHVPRDRICFSNSGYLGFHKASNPDGTPSWQSTIEMLVSYPPDIQAWIEAKGGPEAMPHKGGWILPAPDLWKMGYRKCD